MSIPKVGTSILGAVCVAAFLAIPAPAAAQKGSTFVVTFDRSGTPGVDAAGNPTGAFVNPCTNEFVDVFGSSAITISQVLDTKGNIKTTVNTSTKGTGSGWVVDPIDPTLKLFTGATYGFSETQQFFVKVGVGEAFESDFFDKLAMKGARSTDNWVIRARFRLKISETGEVLVNLVRLNDGDMCKG